MTQEEPQERGERCSTCKQKLELERHGNFWKGVCNCGKIPVKFAEKIPDGWAE